MNQSELDHQVGGNHYKGLQYQVIEWAERNALSFQEGNIIKYLTRWRKKNGVQDVEKAIHYYKLLVEMKSQDHLPRVLPKWVQRSLRIFGFTGLPPIWKLPEFMQQFPELTAMEVHVITVVAMWRRSELYTLEGLENWLEIVLETAKQQERARHEL